MSGHVALDAETGFLQITFPYSPTLVELVKRLPNRRWDRLQKAWIAPISEARAVVELLEPRGFTFAPQVRQRAGQEPDETPGSVPAAALTVSQLTQAARTALNKAFPGPLWLVAELNRIQVKPSGHCYLELLEKSPDREGVAASLAAVIFADSLAVIEKRLTESGGLELADGMEVRILVQPDLYPARGQFQVQIRDIDPAFTLGRLAARREEILRELTRLDLHRRNLELPWPRLPLRVALVTSYESNAYADFTQVLLRSGYGFTVDCIDVRVQGESLEASVGAALAWFERHALAYDVLAIIRGGGSPADLAWFDNLKVALALARHPLKAVVGIGHTQDQSVLDLIAVSCRTPTAAAEELVARVATEADELARASTILVERIRLLLREHREGLARATRRLALALRSRLREELTDLHHLGRRLEGLATATLRQERRILARAGADLAGLPPRIVERERERLQFLERQLSGLSPQRILERGYALVRGPDGRALRTVAAVETGDQMTIELRDGRLAARVEGKDEEEEQERH